MRTTRLLIEILKRLEAEVPPSSNGHHAITFARYGSDMSGWEEKLAIQVNDRGVFRCFFLDDDDLDGTPNQVVSDIVALLKVPDPNEQIGISGVQYVDDATGPA